MARSTLPRLYRNNHPENQAKDHVAGLVRSNMWIGNVMFTSRLKSLAAISSLASLTLTIMRSISRRPRVCFAGIQEWGSARDLWYHPQGCGRPQECWLPVYSTSFAITFSLPMALMRLPLCQTAGAPGGGIRHRQEGISWFIRFGFYEPLTQIAAPAFTLAYNPSIVTRAMIQPSPSNYWRTPVILTVWYFPLCPAYKTLKSYWRLYRVTWLPEGSTPRLNWATPPNFMASGALKVGVMV